MSDPFVLPDEMTQELKDYISFIFKALAGSKRKEGERRHTYLRDGEKQCLFL